MWCNQTWWMVTEKKFYPEPYSDWKLVIFFILRFHSKSTLDSNPHIKKVRLPSQI